MNVTEVAGIGKLPLTQPYRKSSGITISLRRGDIYQPLDFLSGAGWLGDTPPFREYYRSYTRLPLLFVSIRIGSWGWYLGAKVFGADSPTYNAFMPAMDVFVGSQAMMLFTWRMTRNADA